MNQIFLFKNVLSKRSFMIWSVVDKMLEAGDVDNNARI